ncbi:MAG: hypothetical protein ACE5OZ_02380 [Candidatus Heimdallarchaeota archaeon]
MSRSPGDNPANENISDSKEKVKIKEEDYLDTMKEEFKWPFLQRDDLKAAYAVGMYFSIVEYQQKTILNTRGLQKKMRYFFANLDWEKLLKIFASCNEVMIAVQAKKRSASVPYSGIRSQAEILLGQVRDVTKGPELSLAFMFGYDGTLRTYTREMGIN